MEAVPRSSAASRSVPSQILSATSSSTVKLTSPVTVAIAYTFMHNQLVHLPGEHPVTRGEDLWPQGDGVGDVALNSF